MDEPQSLWTRARQWLFGPPPPEASVRPSQVEVPTAEVVYEETVGGQGPPHLRTTSFVGAKPPGEATVVRHAFTEAHTVHTVRPDPNPHLLQWEPPSFVGTLELQDRLGQGATASVYRAVHTDGPHPRTVAVKVIESRSELVNTHASQESAAQTRLRHENLQEGYGTTTLDGKLVLVGECIEGASLKQVLEAGPLSERAQAELAKGLAQGLAHLHAHGVVHGDINPRNIMIAHDGTVKLIDLGSASPRDPTRNDGVFFGTLSFAGPEQYHGFRGNPASDVFAAAATLKLAATGTPVHKAGVNRNGDAHALLTYVRHGPKGWDRKVARQVKASTLRKGPLGAFIANALAYKADARPSAEDLVRLAERTLPELRDSPGASLAERVATVVPTAPRFWRRNPLTGRELVAQPDGTCQPSLSGPGEPLQAYLDRAKASVDPGVEFEVVAVRAAAEALNDGVPRAVVAHGLAGSDDFRDIPDAAAYARELTDEAATLLTDGSEPSLYQVFDRPDGRAPPPREPLPARGGDPPDPTADLEPVEGLDP